MQDTRHKVAEVVTDAGWENFGPTQPDMSDLRGAVVGERPDLFDRAGVTPTTIDQLSVGQQVLHIQFGIGSARRDTGIVTSIDPSWGAVVEFKDGQEKHMFKPDGIHVNGSE